MNEPLVPGYAVGEAWPDLPTLRGVVVGIGLAYVVWHYDDDETGDWSRRPWVVVLSCELDDGTEVAIALDEEDLAAIPAAAILRPLDAPEGQA